MFGIERGSPGPHDGPANFARFQHDGGMIDFGVELERGRFEGVLCGKGHAEEEFSAGVGWILWSHDSHGPLENVIVHEIQVRDEG